MPAKIKPSIWSQDISLLKYVRIYLSFIETFIKPELKWWVLFWACFIAIYQALLLLFIMIVEELPSLWNIWLHLIINWWVLLYNVFYFLSLLFLKKNIVIKSYHGVRMVSIIFTKLRTAPSWKSVTMDLYLRVFRQLHIRVSSSWNKVSESSSASWRLCKITK